MLVVHMTVPCGELNASLKPTKKLYDGVFSDMGVAMWCISCMSPAQWMQKPLGLQVAFVLLLLCPLMSPAQ